MRKSGESIGLFFILPFLCVVGCTTINLQSSLKYPVSLSNAAGKDFSVINHFSEQRRTSFTIGGAITLKDAEIDGIISAVVERYGGDGAANVRIVDEQSATDILLNLGLVLGGDLLGYAVAGVYGLNLGAIVPFFYSTRTVRIEGDVFKYKGGI